MKRKKAEAFIVSLKALREAVNDEQAVLAIDLYPQWAIDVKYEIGDRVLYDSVLYKVLQAHTSQADWMPDVSASLFAKILIPDPTVIPEWEQPESTNPYMKGDKVTHNGKTWVSNIDNNVWEPSVYGWDEVL